MGLPQQTTTNPTEKPSTSETTASDFTPASDMSNQTNSSIGVSDPSQLAGGAIGGSGSGSHGSAEEAADKLYEERMEEEYAKREGGA